ncbi:hypothetical protein HELRODRAFT_178729 [Helobdella robusta]|uniref:Uncharacterized protein n=1 Tax=Helobdella robusta TaxID=6412 RepID=T1FDM9_HELRO|nr:hypothetical protein HELRODRAFT_178729 [Helobdella robusta]ESN96929.1 hypothetical protein HELRODRAFT_178729 [Helobdella robusta]
MQNWLEIYMLNEMLLLFSIVIAFLVLTIFGKRKTWMTTDSFMTVTCGVAFIFFTKQLLKAETEGDIRTMDENVATVFGITLLCSGLSWLMHEKSKDQKTSGVLLAMLSFAYFLNKPNNKPASKDKKNIDWSEQATKTDSYLRIQAIIMFLIGISLIAFPGKVIGMAVNFPHFTIIILQRKCSDIS